MPCCRPSTSHVRHDGRVEQARERRRRLDQRRLHDADLEAVSQLQDDDREERRLPSHELHQLSIPLLLGLHAEGTQSSWRPWHRPLSICALTCQCVGWLREQFGTGALGGTDGYGNHACGPAYDPSAVKKESSVESFQQYQDASNFALNQRTSMNLELRLVEEAEKLARAMKAATGMPAVAVEFYREATKQLIAVRRHPIESRGTKVED